MKRHLLLISSYRPFRPAIHCTCGRTLLAVLGFYMALGTAARADSYRLEFKLEPAQSQMTGRMTLRYRNLSPEPLNEVRLRLDLNVAAKPALTLRSVCDAAGQPAQWAFQPLK